ncbi:zinc-dependent metalloprotease, partial [Odoribacter splanchnicus]
IFHSFLDLIQQWYYCQCAQVDPRIHEEIIPDTLLARIAKFVVTHEVGHSLGLCHNFIGSSAYTVEQLRTPDFVAKYGTTPSIMDYTRFNYIAQPEDKMDSKLLSPNVGIYDCFAIEWGYRYYRHHANSDSLLKEWVTQQQEQRELRFANNSGIDPEVQSEDLSNDLLAANALGIENLKYMKSNEPLWRSGEWANRQIWINRQSWMEIQYNNFLTQAILYIGGINTLTQQPIPIRKQLDAIEFINKYAFSSPEWLFGNHRRTSSFYQEIIRSLIQRCEYVQNSSERYPNNTISIKEYITVLHQTIFDRHQTDRSREILQEVFCKSVLDAMKNSDSQYMKMLWRCELENILDEARQKHFNPQHGQRITDYIKFCMGK